MALAAPPPPSPPGASARGVSVARIVGRFDLEVLTDAGADLDAPTITSVSVNRPGLQWAGYSERFPADQVQVIGRAEVGYLMSLSQGVRLARLEQYAQLGMPAVILTRGYRPTPEAVELAGTYRIPVLGTADPPSELVRPLQQFLAIELAPRVVLHAGLVEVAGEGVLIQGRSGIGKSETALELIRRGHRLIADDTVEVRRPTADDLIGMAPGRMRHFMEVKGIGIVNLRLMYGVGAVKSTGDLSLAVALEPEGAERDGDEPADSLEVLGMHLPLITIPMRPGRNAAVIIEAAAMDIRARRLLRPHDVEDRSDVRADLLEQV